MLALLLTAVSVVTREAEAVACSGVTQGMTSAVTLMLAAVTMEALWAGMFTKVAIVARVTQTLSCHPVTCPVVLTVTL